MASVETANTQDAQAPLDVEPVRSNLSIFDLVLIGGLTIALSAVFGLAYAVYLGTQGYTSQEIVGYFDLPEGRETSVLLGLGALFIGPVLLVPIFARLRGVQLSDLGFRRSDRRYYLYAFLGLVFVLGVGLALERFLDASDIALLNEANDDLLASEGLPLLVSLIFVILLLPFAEELFFRAAFYNAFTRYMPNLAAGFLGTCIFTAVHTQYLFLGGQAAAVGLFQIFLLGGILMWLYGQSRSIWPPVFLHSANNAVAFLVVTYLG